MHRIAAFGLASLFAGFPAVAQEPQASDPITRVVPTDNTTLCCLSRSSPEQAQQQKGRVYQEPALPLTGCRNEAG